MPPQPFSLHVPDADITDLKVRLARTRLPDQAPDAPWSYGTDVAYLSNLLAYWQDGFDWRAQEARLNSFPQVMVPIAGIRVHALHVPGNGPDPMPLLLLHGWPGSVFEFLDIIPRLTDPARFGNDPADAFTIVAPSLPGYGLSFQPGQQRFGIRAMANAAADLMTALGHQRFGAQGGDWGATVSTKLGLQHADRLTGVHLNFLSAVRRDPSLFTDPAPEVQAFAAELAQFVKEETGYQVIQGTKPQTLAFALNEFTVRPGRLVRRKVPHLDGLRRRSRKCADARPDAGGHCVLLVHRMHRRLVLALLRTPARPVDRARGTHRRRARGLCGVPARDPASAALRGGTVSPTSAAGPSCPAAATSRQWSNPRHSPTKSVPFSAISARRLSVPSRRRRAAAPLARIAVGTPITERPPHRTVRAAFPHTAPTLGV